MTRVVGSCYSDIGAYTPDAEAFPQDWPPAAYQKYGAEASTLPAIQWQPTHRRPPRLVQLVRLGVLLGVVIFALIRLYGWLA